MSVRHLQHAQTTGRWTRGFSLSIASLAILAFLPVFPWAYRLWFGGVLGGGASAILSLPIAFVLGIISIRHTSDVQRNATRKGADAAMLALGCLLIFTLHWAQSNHAALLLAGCMLPPLIWSWIWARYGWGLAVRLTLPIGFLFFALPWEHFLKANLEVQLQIWTTDVAIELLRLAQYDVWYHNEYTIDSKRYYVIVNETCSGVNLTVTLLMYTLVFGWLVQPSMLGRTALIALVFPLALFANGVRVATIFLLGHYGGVEWADGFWHTGSAYLIFLPVFWFLYLVNGRLLNRLHRERPKAKKN